MSEGKNQPNRIESWLLQEDEKPLTLAEDAKLPNAATITLRNQDHTLGHMIRCQLLLDPTVLFAGYKVPHPQTNNIELKIQCDDRSNPADALKRACTLLIQQTAMIKQQFVDQAKNIEMGMGPEAGGMGMGMGGRGAGGAYDPYADGLGGGGPVGGANGAGGDVYDF